MVVVNETFPDDRDGGVGVVGEELVEVAGDAVQDGVVVGLSLLESGGCDLPGQGIDDRPAWQAELSAEPLNLLVAFGGATYGV